MSELLSPVIAGTLAAAVLLTCATVGLVLRLRSLERRIAQAVVRFDGVHEKDREAKQKAKAEASGPSQKDLRDELESLRSLIKRIPGETVRQVQGALEKWSQEPAHVSPPVDDLDYEPAEPQDAMAQLLAMANRIVQQGSTTLEAFRASTGALAMRVSAWPSSADGAPLAFIVEHRGAHYAVPNVIKPARLPKEWFNRSDFGVNDEIQRVVSLPSLRRRGDGYDVQQAGVFDR